MNEEIRHQIVQRRQGGASIRRIARDLNVARDTVQCVIRRWEADRAGQGSAAPAVRRPSLVDPFHDAIRQLLERYPDITIQRVFEELRLKGFAGGRSIVRERVLELRPKPSREPVVRFETSPGLHYVKQSVMLSGSGGTHD
jgi:transposase